MQDYFGPERVSKRSVAKSYGVVFFLIVAFLSGWSIGVKNTSNQQQADGAQTVANTGVISSSYTAEPDFQLFWDLWDKIKQDYVNQPIDDRDLFYGAMHGLIAALDDPYSEYFNPEDAALFGSELEGSFSGIGIEIGVKNQLLVVIAPLEGSPGDLAGLKAGDIIIQIEGEDTYTMTLDGAVSRIRGEEGTPVKLIVLSKEGGDPREVEIIRKKIEHTGMYWKMLDGNIIHIKFSSFDQDAENMINKLVREVEQTKEIKGLILDMRNNPGGFLDMSIEVASEWVEDGVIVYERDNNGEERQHNARGRARLANYPTVVLINAGSASASEIVAGALQDYGIATLVGEKTYGKGSVQKYEILEDGSAYRLTVAKWYTPLDHSIDEVGITPDIVVELTADDFNNDLDPQLDKALELLRN